MFAQVGAAGSEVGTAHFYMIDSNPAGESGIGTIDLYGWANVSAGVIVGDKSIEAWAKGDVGNTGTVIVSGTPNPTLDTTITGTGVLNLATLAVIGGGADGLSSIKDGGFAGAALTGSFGYEASGGSGWTGNGQILGSLDSTVKQIDNGWSSTAKGHLVITVCPK
jgi:hypothetical protein